MPPTRPHHNPQPSYIYHCPTVTCYHWNAGQCTYSNTACSYAHSYTGKLGPRHLNKSWTCLYWIENGGCAAGEDGCQFAHFWTGRVAEGRDYHRGNYFRKDLGVLRRGGDMGKGLEEVEVEVEVSPSDDRREITTETSEPRVEWTEATWHAVDGESVASEGSADMSIDDSDMADDDSLGATDMAISDSSMDEYAPFPLEPQMLEHLPNWPPSNGYTIEPFHPWWCTSADPSTMGSSWRGPGSSPADDEGSDSGESDSSVEIVTCDPPRSGV